MSTNRRADGWIFRRQNIKYLGTAVILLSPVPYLVLAVWVNIFSPELIVSNYPFGVTDPISADIGGWTFIIGFPLGLAVVLAGWMINGHFKDRSRAGKGRRVALGAFRGAASLVVIILSVILTPLVQLLLMIIPGRG